MGVFQGEKPVEATQALVWAAQRLVTRAAERGLLPAGLNRWSTAELLLDEDDYQWLLDCVRRASQDAIQHLPSISAAGQATIRGREACGFLLLTLIAEWARREAEEDGARRLWPDVQGLDCWRGKSFLFDEGAPTPALTDRLKAAADRFGLRQCHRTSGSYHIVNTVFLQFGFTRQGCFERLSDWIAGGGTYAMRELLGLGEDADNGGSSFRELVRALRRYKRRQWPKERLIETLDLSPWVLPQWREPLLEALDRAGDVAYDAALDELPIRDLLGQPRLRWYGLAPRLELAIETDRQWPSAYQALRYRVWITGDRRVELIRRGEGTDACYRLRTPMAVVSLAWDDYLPPVLSAQVRDDDGQVAEECGPWRVYDPTHEVNLWDERGRRLEPQSRLDPARSYTLMVPEDYRLESRPQPQWRAVGAGRLYLLTAPWPSETRLLTADGELVWQPATGEVQHWPGWLADVTVQVAQQLTFGDMPEVRIQGSPLVRIEWARVDGEPRAVRSASPGTASVAGSGIQPRPGCERLDITIGASLGGEERSRSFRVALPLCGDVLLPSSGGTDDELPAWQVLGPASVIRRTGKPPKLALYRTGNTGWHELRAGEQDLGFVDLVGGRTVFPLPQWPVGLGEELALWRDGEQVRVLGTIRSARSFDDLALDGDLLVLPRSEPPGPDHRVVWWGWGGRVLTLEPVGEEDVWLVEAPDSKLPRAVAVSWRGQWQEDSTWCDERWFDRVEELGAAAVVVAAWLHLPMLAEPALTVLKGMAQDHGREVLGCWLAGAGLPEEFSPPAEEIGAALRSALGLQPSAMGWGLPDLVALLDAQPPAAVLRKLAGWDASWTVSLLREWVMARALSEHGLMGTGRIVDDVVDGLGEAAPDDLRALAEELAAVRQERERWLKSMQLP